MFVKKLINLLSVALLLSAFFLMSCEKEGPAGPAGKDGQNGKDANIVCGTCHSDTKTDVKLKFAQYDLSKHNKGVIYEEEAGRIQCGGCHSGDGFAEAASLGKDDPVASATSKINCQACHTIHNKFDSTDWALRITAGFKLRHTGADVDFKTGNICAKCHQARAYTRTTPDTVKPASATSTYSRFGPHYGIPANMVSMNGPVKIPGSVAYPTSNPHASLAKGCISCHMNADASNPAVGGHTFLMPIANLSKVTACTTCHDAATIAAGAKMKENATLLAQYRQKLIEKKWLDTTQAVTADGYQVLGEYFATPDKKAVVFQNPDDVSVVLNYLYLAKDRSRGAHNPAYFQALLKNGLEYLNK